MVFDKIKKGQSGQRLIIGILVLSLAMTIGLVSQANAASFTLTQNSTWDTNTGDDTQAAATGDNVNIVTFDLTISNASTVKQLDALTGTTGDLLITAGTTTSGSLLWNGTNDYWEAGPTGSEAQILTTGNTDADILTFSLPASTTISAFGKTLVDDADAAAVRTTIGLENVDNTSDAAKNAATAKIGNRDALVNPPLVIANAHFINFVESFIGTTTSSSIGTVTPQYPVCRLFFPLAKVGVILILAFNFFPSLFKKYVLVLCSPCLIAFESHIPTFCITISPGEKRDTLFFPTNSSLE